jgi:hypothetical protein
MRIGIAVFRSAIVLGALSLLSLPLAAQSGQGHLKTKVSPGRAGVFVDGKYMGPAANFRIGRKYALPAGQHEIRLSEPRYEDYVAKVDIPAGKTFTLRQSLKPLPPAKPPFGVLRTVYPEKYAAVYVNNKYMGHVDEFDNGSEGLKLNPGEYELKIVPVAGGAGHEEKIRIETGKVTVVRPK